MGVAYHRRMAENHPPSLAERKRQLVSDELRDAALQLLAAKGFDAATIDDIVAAAGVSRRTFFRYYSSKEDVVVRLLAEVSELVREELTARPADESTAEALHQAVAVAVDDCAGNEGKALPVVRLILRTPALHARWLERRAGVRAELAAVLARRLGREPGDLYPDLAAGMALAAFDTVVERWADSDGTADPHELTARAFAVLAPALNA